MALLGFDESFQLHLAVDDLDDVFDITAIFLLLEVFGLFQDKLVKARSRKLSGLFASMQFGLHKGLVELVDLFGFALRLGADHAESTWRGRRGGLGRLWRLLGLLQSAFRLDRFRGRAEVPLDGSLFFLLGFFTENVFILRVGLSEVVQAESLAVLEVAAALAISLNHRFNTPFDFRGRALSAAPEVLVEFNLELTDVPFELAQLFVDGRHGWKCPLKYHARSREQNRQQAPCLALRIVYPTSSGAVESIGTQLGVECFIARGRALW